MAQIKKYNDGTPECGVMMGLQGDLLLLHARAPAQPRIWTLGYFHSCGRDKGEIIFAVLFQSMNHTLQAIRVRP